MDHLIAEHGNRREVRPQGQLVRREQRPAGDAEFLPASLALETKRARVAAHFVSIQTAARGTDRSAIGLRPADLAERRLGRCLSHPHNVQKGEGLGG